MPDSNARQWFVNVAKMFSNQATPTSMLEHAQKIGVENYKDLMLCVQDTTSNTARQVVRLLFKPTQLVTMSGTEIPISVRKAIRGEFSPFIALEVNKNVLLRVR
jgi:hypothetical protein